MSFPRLYLTGVKEATYEVLGRGDPPVPVPVGAEDLSAGRFHYQRISEEGVGRSAEVVEEGQGYRSVPDRVVFLAKMPSDLHILETPDGWTAGRLAGLVAIAFAGVASVGPCAHLLHLRAGRRNPGGPEGRCARLPSQVGGTGPPPRGDPHRGGRTGILACRMGRTAPGTPLGTGYHPAGTGDLTLIARGNANKQIAAELGIGEDTVKGHVSSILAKLNARDRAQASAEAIRRGLIDV